MSRKPKRVPAGTSVLVTGADGFIGRALVARLKRDGCRVSSVDKAAGFDVCDWSHFKCLLRRRWDLVYHLAGVMHVPSSWKHPRETFSTNVLGTLNVLEFCRLSKVSHLVFVSSAMYGMPEYLPIDERHPVDPTNPYSWSKSTAEDLCRAYGKLFGMNITILRPFNIYGRGQRPDFLVPSVVEQVRRSGSVKVNDLAPKRDYLHIDDMTEAFVAAGRKKKQGVDVFNIGSGKSHSVREVIDAAFEAAGAPRKVSVTGKKRRGDIPDVVADIRAAQRDLKWSPEVDLREGIASMMQ